MTGENCRQFRSLFPLSVIDQLVYPLRGRVGLKRGDGKFRYFSQPKVYFIREHEIWCKIQVIINPVKQVKVLKLNYEGKVFLYNCNGKPKIMIPVKLYITSGYYPRGLVGHIRQGRWGGDEGLGYDVNKFLGSGSFSPRVISL